ncbi:MAG TPA: hypothetical protein VHB47_18415 [Thermoanaerobaculia bacterium]|jgi:hypothetical protein|nr:hypothetical protein [Thermoanaerobaculia bacterium]
MKSKALLLSALLIGFAVATVPAVADQCGNSDQVTLFGGQTIDTGTVTVTNDASSVTVTYATNDPWVITAVHLAVADSLAGIPQNKNSNPLPGHFAINTTYNPPVTTVTFIIPIDNITSLQSLFIGAQAEVQAPGGQGGSQTAWGFGPRFGGHNWATYINYPVQGCGTIE